MSLIDFVAVKRTEKDIAMDRTGKGFVASMSASFVLIGMFGSFLGPLALLIMEYYGITPVEYSWLSTLMSVAGLGATFFLLFFGDRVNKIKLLCAALGILIVALYLFSSAPPFAGILLIGVIAGFMAVLIDVTTNAITLEAFAEHKTTLIPRLYSIFDSGTVFGPLYVTLLVMPAVAATFVRPYFILGIAGIPVFVFMLASAKKIMPHTPYAHIEKKPITYGLDVFKTKKVWFIITAGICMYFVYSGVIVWMPTFAQLEAGTPFRLSGLLVTVFFLSAIVFRFFSPIIYKRISSLKCVFLFGFAFAACTCLINLCTNTVALFLLLAISGPCCCVAITSLVLFASEIYKGRPSTVAAISLMEFSIGNAASPILMSLIAEKASFGEAFLAVGIICAAGISILGVGLARRSGRNSASER